MPQARGLAGQLQHMNTALSSPASQALIVCEHLGKAYAAYSSPQQRLRALFRPSSPIGDEGFWALRDLSFQLQRGQALGVIGRNGAGKSTLLQLLCGTLTPTTGQLAVNGRIAALLELGAGFNLDFTGIENVYLNAAILGLTRSEIDARLDDILAYADIGDFVHQPVKHYSSGMFLRLAFAVVAHVNADVLIIDEALAVGDALFAQKCMRFLRNFREQGALLLVSHDIPSVTSLCDEALWLERGRMRMLGSAKNVTEAYLEAIYAEQQKVDGAGGDGAGDARTASPAPNAPAQSGAVTNTTTCAVSCCSIRHCATTSSSGLSRRTAAVSAVARSRWIGSGSRISRDERWPGW